MRDHQFWKALHANYVETVGDALRNAAREAHPLTLAMVPALRLYLDDPHDVQVSYDADTDVVKVVDNREVPDA